MDTAKKRGLSRRLLLGSAAAGSIGAAAASLLEGADGSAEAGEIQSAGVGFALEFDGVKTAFFRSLSGLSSENEVIEFKSGDGGPVRKIPGRLKYGDIVLKRGITSNLDLWDWRKSVEDGKVETARKDGAIVMVSVRGRKELARWNFYEGWPARISAELLEPGATDSTGMAIERIEIAIEKVERVR